MPSPRAFVYIVRCRDGTLYTGTARDIAQRLAQHDAGKGAKYTRSRGPVKLLWQEGPMTVSRALRREHQLKQLTVGSSRVDLQACKLEYSIVSPK